MKLTPKTTSPYGIDVPGGEVPTATQSRRPKVRARRAAPALGISDFCFIVAAISALGGMTLGIVMGLSQDFILAPAHAHLNLLGWVTMALYGLYHRSVGRTSGIAGWVQAASGALGALFMAGGLGLYLSHGHDDRFVPLVITGSLLAVIAMLMFLGLVLHDLRGRRLGAFEATAQSG